MIVNGWNYTVRPIVRAEWKWKFPEAHPVNSSGRSSACGTELPILDVCASVAIRDLTLPAAIVLSGGLFVLFRYLF
jgi:hypothetical protein